MVLKFTILFLICVKWSSGEAAEAFLKRYNNEMSRLNMAANIAVFNQNVNMTEENIQKYTDLAIELSNIEKKFQKEAIKIDLSNTNEFMKRQLKLLSLSASSKDQNVTKNLENLKGKLQQIYSKATVRYNASIIRSLKLPASTKTIGVGKLAEVFAKSSDPVELEYCWKEWRNAIGPKVKKQYEKMVQLINIGAQENGFKDGGDFNRRLYEVDNLEGDVEKFWNELKPFYDELHAYVRYKLSKIYPDHVKPNKPIPAHLLGNIWTTDWYSIFSKIMPFPGEPKLDITPKLKEMVNVTGMIKMAEKFFISLGWSPLPTSFWTNSLFTKPDDRVVVCQPGAYDVGGKINGEQDVRLSMCGDTTQYYFNIVHHELGHLYYFLFYANLPYKYRVGANPAFHEAVGDALLLSAESPEYLQNIGLLNEISTTKESEINHLMKSALRSIAFLPYGITLDKWRWEVFKGNIKPVDYNKKWWELRLKYQGIVPPSQRNESDFDAAAKFHVIGDVPYIRYFFAVILKHIFHEEGCKAAKFKGPIHQCSIHDSKAAGKKLRKMLELGKSKPWPEVLRQLTGSREMTIKPVTNFYKPLLEYLRKERSERMYPIGWDETKISKGATRNADCWVLMSIFAAVALLM